MIILILLFISPITVLLKPIGAFAGNKASRASDEFNSNPGVKFSFPKNSLDYIVGQVFPWLEEQLKSIKLPDIKHQKIYVPIGPVYFTLDHDELTNFKISSPSFKIVSGNSIRVKVDDLYIKGKGDWSYEEKSFPHIKDHGTIDLDNLLVSLSIDFGAKIDSSHKSNVRITSDNFNVDWKTFDVSVHGGAQPTSWIYNAVINNFKSTLEGYISSSLKDTIPSTLINLLQPVIDNIPYTYIIPNPHNLEMTYLPQEVNFNADKNYLSVGAIGAMEHDSKLPPGSPSSIPDVVSGSEKMCQTFFSEWAFQSASYAVSQAGILNYVVQSSPSFPLNTKNFALFIPQLEQKWPNKTMQVTLSATEGTLPEFKFKSSGYYISASMDSAFQVLNASSSSSSSSSFGNNNDDNDIVTAFILQSNITLNFTAGLKQGKEEYEYNVVGKLGMNSLSVTLEKSIVGNFNATILQNMIQQMIVNFALPNINEYFQNGIPIPTTKVFQLKTPQLLFFEEYFVAEFDFNFFPPTEMF